jgi:hypothetical protein
MNGYNDALSINLHHGFSAVFRQPLDGVNGHQRSWRSVGGNIYTPYSEESGKTLFLSENLASHSKLT